MHLLSGGVVAVVQGPRIRVTFDIVFVVGFISAAFVLGRISGYYAGRHDAEAEQRR